MMPKRVVQPLNHSAILTKAYTFLLTEGAEPVQSCVRLVMVDLL